MPALSFAHYSYLAKDAGTMLQAAKALLLFMGMVCKKKTPLQEYMRVNLLYELSRTPTKETPRILCHVPFKREGELTCAGLRSAWLARASAPLGAESEVTSMMTNSMNFTAVKRTPSETGSVAS